MIFKTRKKSQKEARAKAFLKQVNFKKEKDLTRAYMALRSSQRVSSGRLKKG